MTPGQRAVIAALEELGFPVTRENYITVNWNDDPPEPWTAEDEAELPEELQSGDEEDEDGEGDWPVDPEAHARDVADVAKMDTLIRRVDALADGRYADALSKSDLADLKAQFDGVAPDDVAVIDVGVVQDLLDAVGPRADAYDPSESRDPGGKWTGGGGAEGMASPREQLEAATAARKALGERLIDEVPGARQKIDATRAKLSKLTPTDKMFKQADGTWTPEREQLHRDIVQRLLTHEAVQKATPKAGEQPTVTILGGRGGSGKGALTKPGGAIDLSHALYLNSDDIKAMLPEYQGWNAAQLHEESSHVLNMAEHAARKLGLNVVQDGTLKSWHPSAERLNEYMKHGYKTKLSYVDVKPETSARRAIKRFVGPTGRYVDPDYILGSTTNRDSFEKLRPFVDDWDLWSNEEEAKPGEKAGPVLMERKGGQ